VWPIIALAYLNRISFAIRSMQMKHVFTTKIFGIQVVIRQLLDCNFIYAKLVSADTTE
jgi:hypothetical protein